MTPEKWKTLGFQEVCDFGYAGWEKYLPNGISIIITGIDDEEGCFPLSNGPYTIGMYSHSDFIGYAILAKHPVKDELLIAILKAIETELSKN
jgi:hypothetical protein